MKTYHVRFFFLCALLAWTFAARAVPPSIFTQPSPINTSTNASVSFSTFASGTPPLTFQWRLNGVDIPGAKTTYTTASNASDSYDLQSVQTDDGGSYSVVVYNNEGSVSSSKADLTITNIGVLPVRDAFVNRQFIPQTVSGVMGRTNNFSATHESSAPKKHGGKPGKHSVWVRWKAAETGIAVFDTGGSGFDTTLSVYTGTALTGLTQVAHDDDHGRFLRSRVQFNVVANTEYSIAMDGFYEAAGNLCLHWDTDITSDVVPAITNATSDVAAPAGSSVTIAVALDSTGTSDTYQWYRNGQSLAGQSGLSLDINPVTSNTVGVYRFEVSVPGQSGKHTNVSDDIQVQINSFNGTNFDSSAIAQRKFRDASDNGVGVLVAAPAAGYSGSQIFSTFGAVKEPGEPNHCSEAGGATYWYSYQPPASGALTVDALGGFNNLIAVYTSTDITNFAALTSVACSSTNPVAGHEISTFNVTSGTVYYLVSDGVGGASGSVNLAYTLAAPPSVTGQPGGLTVNQTSNASFSVSASGSSNLKYQWRLNTTNNVFNATNATLNVTNCQPTNAGNYTCVITNAYGATTSGPATLTVRTPIVISNQPAATAVLQGATAQFTVVAGGTSPAYQWRFNGANNILNATSSSLSVVNAQSTNAGNYTVVITNAVNAVTSTVAALTVNVPPSITNQPSSQTVVQSSNVSLTVGATGSAPLAYQWRTNGNNFSGRTANPLTLTNFQSTNEGSYDVIVTNSYGAVTSSSASLFLIASNSASRFTNWSYPTNTFVVTLLGSPLSNYAVLTSTNTTNWTSISTNNSASGIMPLAVTNSQGYTNLIFRARTP